MRYEYERITIRAARDWDELAGMGEEGWEAFNTTAVWVPDLGTMHTWYLRRVLPDEEDA